MMSVDKILPVIASGVIAGGLSSIGTVSALQVHITYLKESDVRHDRVIESLSDRMSLVEMKTAK